jgi:hypothetical protein
MWLMMSNIYLEYKVDPLRYKEVTVKNNIFEGKFYSQGEINLIILVLDL